MPPLRGCCNLAFLGNYRICCCRRSIPGNWRCWENYSNAFTAHGSVLNDYTGDELFAMWDAPEEQPRHAERACQAAQDMLNKLPQLNERWQSTLGEPMSVGIGVNTGPARVGNITIRTGIIPDRWLESGKGDAAL